MSSHVKEGMGATNEPLPMAWEIAGELKMGRHSH